MAESVPFGPRMIPTLRRAFTGACVAWAGALPAATCVSALSQPPVPLALFAVLIYAVGGSVCHQRPERSFYLWGRQLPVCARCTGIYAGAALAVAVVSVRRALQMTDTRPRRLSRSPAVLVVIASAPTAATLVFEWTTGV